MKKKKKKPVCKRMRFKHVIIILLCGILLPSNYSGKSVYPKNVTHFVSVENEQSLQNHISDEITVPNTNDPKEDAIQQNVTKITVYFVLFAVSALMLSTVLLTLMLRYFKNIGIVKRNLLICLYEDTLKIFLCIEWCTFATILSCYLNGDGKLKNKSMAKVFCYSFTFLSILLLLVINCMSALKLYILKKNVIDPPMPWNENNCINDKTISKFRFRSILFASITICIMYLTKTYPSLYYFAIGDEESAKDLPAASKLNEVFHLILVLSYITITFVYQICEARKNRIMSRVPHRFQNLPRAFLIIMAFIFFLAVYTKYFRTGRVFVISQLMVIVFGVMSPAWIIATSDLLRQFVKTELINARKYIKTLLIKYQLITHFLRQFRRHSSTIQPIT